LEVLQTPETLQQKGKEQAAMDESKSGPLDGIIEEEPAKQETATENHKSRVTAIGGTGHGTTTFLPDDGIRKLRETQSADVISLQNQLRVMNAMILALRAAVGGAVVGAIFAVLQTRKLSKRVAALEGGSKHKEITIEAQTVQSGDAKKLPTTEVGD
jgi:hypothetical protein